MNNEKNVFIMENGPHQKNNYSTQKIMFDVCIALIPVLVVSILFYRMNAILVIVSCCLGACLGEIAVQKLCKKKSTILDGSALVTGLLLAFSLPPAFPFGLSFFGGLISTAIVKQLFGGLGFNIFNPAMAGRAFLMAAYPVLMTTWTQPYSLATVSGATSGAVDAVSGATPLALWKFSHQGTDLFSLFLGNVSGSIGETSVVAILLGGLYLFVKKAACFKSSLAMLIATLVFTGIMYVINPQNGSPLFHVFAGGYFIALIFMVTDPVTTPMSSLGRYIFGAGVGLMIPVIRYWGGLPEGTMYSILFMNMLVPLIDKGARTIPFGRGKHE